MGQNMELNPSWFPRVLSPWSLSGCASVPSSEVWRCVKCCLLGKPTRDPVSRIFTGSWSQRHPLPSTYQTSHSEGKQVLSIRYVVCANGVGKGMLGQRLTSKFPDASRGPALQGGLFEESSLGSAVSTPFCTATR